MCFYLNGDVELPEAGLLIQPNLPWIVVTTGGLISDASSDNYAIRILRIICLRSLRNGNIEVILSDFNFLIEEKKGVLVLKKIILTRTFHKLSTTNESL